MNLIIISIIGGLVGWMARIVLKTNAQMGLIANVAVGVVGSIRGFWVAGMPGFAAAGGHRALHRRLRRCGAADPHPGQARHFQKTTRR